MGRKLLLCDSLVSEKEQYDAVVNFSYSNDENEYSIPKIIEDNSDNFRANYLEWVYKLGRESINGETVIDQLSIRKDFSFWWTTLIFEKSKWKSPGLYKVFQLMALYSVLAKFDDISSIDISLSDKNIQKSIQEWCAKRKVNLNNICFKSKKINYFSFKNIFDSAPHFIRAMIWIINYAFKSWPRHRYGYETKLHSGKGSLLIISYFLNIDKTQANNKTFRTGYWTSLHELLPGIKKKVNWLHLFVKSNDYQSPTEANYLLKDLNKNNRNAEMHDLLDNSLCLSVILNTLKDYARIVLTGYRIKNVNKCFVTETGDTEINLWNVLGYDWKCSIFGKTAIANCLYLNLFEKAFNEIPTQYQGLYLLENLPWERCMIYAWRKNNHGSIIGVPHTIVSYWDLRHFLNVNEYRELEKYKMPLPDKVALNGPFGLNMYVNNLFPKDRIVEAEALRYLHLHSYQRNENNPPISENTLLVLCDSDPIIMSNQMQLLSQAVKMLTFSINIIVKPHPLSSISEKQFPDLKLSIVSDSIESLSSKYSVAFTSNSTAASLDAYLIGKRVIVMLDSNSFNMSPLRGHKDVDFITTGEGLSNKISAINNIIKRPNNNFFYIDPKLSRWNRLLKSFD